MATLGASMVTLLTDNWAGAGAPPTFGFLIDFQKELEDTEEQVLVRLPIHEDVDPINDNLSNFKFTMQLRVKTTVSEARLKVLTDETIRIVNSYAITGITRQFAKRGENTSDRKRQVFSYDVWANLEEHASTAGTAYASPGAGDVPFPRDVSIARDLAVTRNATVGGTLEVTGVTTLADESLTSTQISDLLMFGSANAAWIPCSVLIEATVGKWKYGGQWALANVDGTNAALAFNVTQPMVKGALKLYIKGVQVIVQDADAAAFVDRIRVTGLTFDSTDTFGDVGTNRTAADKYTSAFTTQDCSGFDEVHVYVEIDVDAGDELDIRGVEVHCYYAS